MPFAGSWMYAFRSVRQITLRRRVSIRDRSARRSWIVPLQEGPDFEPFAKSLEIFPQALHFLFALVGEQESHRVEKFVVVPLPFMIQG